MKRILPILLILALLAGCGSSTVFTEETARSAAAPSAETQTEAQAEAQAETVNLRHIEIDVQDYGTIAAELYPDVAPITVENFCDLAKSGFYNGLTFHRIIDGFMIQGGDPEGNGSGGSGKNVKGEFSANGVDNDISHVRGVLSMARATPPDSASSQFFIVHQDSAFLDGNYAAFGMVTSGMEVVDAICAATPVQDDNGTVAWWDQPVITEIRVLD